MSAACTGTSFAVQTYDHTRIVVVKHSAALAYKMTIPSRSSTNNDKQLIIIFFKGTPELTIRWGEATMISMMRGTLWHYESSSGGSNKHED